MIPCGVSACLTTRFSRDTFLQRGLCDSEFCLTGMSLADQNPRKDFGIRSMMIDPLKGAVQPPPRHLRRWVATGVALVGLLIGGGIGWKWFQAHSERREALALAEERRFDLAEPMLRQLHERNPRDVDILAALAVGSLRERRYAEA